MVKAFLLLFVRSTIKDFVLMIALLLTIQVSGQSSDDPKLVHAFDPRECETLMIELDTFAAEVTRDKVTTGYIIVRKGDDPIDNVSMLRSIQGHIRLRGVSEERLVVFSASGSKDPHVVVELWTSRGKTPPSFTEAKFDLKLASDQRRLLFNESSVNVVKIDGKDTLIEVGCEVCCTRMIGSWLLLEVLKENPSFDVEVIVGAYTMPKYRKFVELIRQDIVSDKSIRAERIKFYYGGVDKNFSSDLGRVKISFVGRPDN